MSNYENPPLLLLPGLLCDAALWRQQAPRLGVDRPVRVMDLSFAASIERAAQMVLAAAPPRFALAGLSMGGYVALEICRRAPGRVDRLALLDTNAHADPAEASQRRRAQVAQALDGDFDGVLDTLIGALVAPANRERADIAGTFGAMAHRLGPQVFARQQQAIMGRRDQQDLLPTLHLPALVLCGALDQLTTPAIHQAMAARLPMATYCEVPDCGHLSTLEAPAAVTEALAAWLAA